MTKEKKLRTRTCKACFAIFERGPKECPQCGQDPSVKPKKEKIVLSELELAEKQAARMFRDMKRLQKTQDTSSDKKDQRSNVDLWKDTDFFFSVVFKSAAQKYAFMEKFSELFKLGLEEVRHGDRVYSIFNGIKLADNLNIKIPVENNPEFPYPNLEMRELALDSEEF